MSGIEQEQDEVLQVGQIIRPQMSQDTARELAERLYGLKVKSVKELNSYDDKNYFMMTELQTTNPHIKEVCPDGYVLKVLNSMDSKKKHVDAEHQVQALLAKEGFTVPVPVLNVHGRDLSHEKIYAETSSEDSLVLNNNPPEEAAYGIHIVRLLTFIPGVIFHTIPYTAPHLYQVGQFIGNLDRLTKDFYHPALETKSVWDLKNTPKLKDFVYAVTDESDRKLAEDVLKAFDDVVVPAMDRLPRGAIHGDCNEQNIIMRALPDQGDKPPEEREYRIHGIIDFGDMRYSPYVFEIAIAITYMMIESNMVDPLVAGGHVLAGYLAEMELDELEWSVLKECVAARFAASLIMGAYTFLQDPGNEYVLTTAAQGWKRMRQLWDTPKEELYTVWKGVIDSYKK